MGMRLDVGSPAPSKAANQTTYNFNREYLICHPPNVAVAQRGAEHAYPQYVYHSASDLTIRDGGR